MPGMLTGATQSHLLAPMGSTYQEGFAVNDSTPRARLIEAGPRAYVLSLSNGVIKVGSTVNFRTRYGQLASQAKVSRVSIVKFWVSTIHSGYQGTEDLLRGFCRQNGASISLDYFENVSYRELIQFANSLAIEEDSEAGGVSEPGSPWGTAQASGLARLSAFSLGAEGAARAYWSMILLAVRDLPVGRIAILIEELPVIQKALASCHEIPDILTMPETDELVGEDEVELAFAYVRDILTGRPLLATWDSADLLADQLAAGGQLHPACSASQ